MFGVVVLSGSSFLQGARVTTGARYSVGPPVISGPRPLLYWPQRPASPLLPSWSLTRGVWLPFKQCAPPPLFTQQLQDFVAPLSLFNAYVHQALTDLSAQIF